MSEYEYQIFLLSSHLSAAKRFSGHQHLLFLPMDVAAEVVFYRGFRDHRLAAGMFLDTGDAALFPLRVQLRFAYFEVLLLCGFRVLSWAVCFPKQSFGISSSPQKNSTENPLRFMICGWGKNYQETKKESQSGFRKGSRSRLYPTAFPLLKGRNGACRGNQITAMHFFPRKREVSSGHHRLFPLLKGNFIAAVPIGVPRRWLTRSCPASSHTPPRISRRSSHKAVRRTRR